MQLRKNSGQRTVDAPPFGEQLIQHASACVREPVEALVALALFPPFTHQQTLRLQAAQQRVERALVHRQAVLGEHLAQGVAVLLAAQGREGRDDEAASSELQTEVVEDLRVHRVRRVHTV